MQADFLDFPYWFELAVVFFLCAVGGIVFSAFTRYDTKWRGVVKILIGGALAVTVTATAGRSWFFVLLAG